MADEAKKANSAQLEPAKDTPSAEEKGGCGGLVYQQIVNSKDLNLLNLKHDYAVRSLSADGEIKAPGGASLYGRVSRRLFRFVREKIFGSYLRDSFEFHAALVRYLNELSAVVGARALWQEDQGNAERAASSARTDERFSAESERTQKLFSELESRCKQLDERLTMIEGVTTGLERLLIERESPSVSSRTRRKKKAVSGEESGVDGDLLYVLFENRFRGPEEEIRKRLRPYVEYFRSAEKPVLEIGAGRGELQALFKEAKVPSYGVELDASMVGLAVERELDVRHENGLEHLSRLDDHSLSGLIAVQLIEHLKPPDFMRLLRLSSEKVENGGRVILETVNTASLVSLMQNYFRDPTHLQPVHPDTVRFMVEMSGLRVLEVKKLEPFPEAVLLRELEASDFMPPRWAATVEHLNQNIRRLNSLLFDCQDYCIVAEVV